jgi:hypothetical protein
MPESTTVLQQFLDVLIQLVTIATPIVVTWFIRTYVQGTTAERDIAAIVRLSNTAIDYAENLDKRGDLVVSPNMSRGIQKLHLASSWLENELNRAGVKITDEEAQQWIAAEFQKRVGDVRLGSTVARLTQEAVTMVQDLERRQLIEPPPAVDRLTYLAGLGADYLVTGLAQNSVTLPREQALTYVRAALLRQFHIPDENLPRNERLLALARQSLAFLEELKAKGQFQLQGTMEADVAVAWLVTEAAKQGLAVSTEEINEAITAVLSVANNRPASPAAPAGSE